MKFQPGDKVQLINEAVKATVSKTFSETELYVLDENGFEFRVKVSDLVPLSNESYMEENESALPEDDETRAAEKSILKYFTNFHSCFLCVVPEDFENILSSGYTAVIVNSSDETLLYSLHFPDDAEHYSSCGIIEPGTESTTALSGSGTSFRGFKFLLRFLIHSSKSKTGQREFSFAPEDFLNEKLFLSRELFRNHILAFDVHASTEMEIPEGEIKKLVDYFSPEKNIPKKDVFVSKRRTEETVLFTNEKTVDLHIEELTDDYSGMSNTEIMHLQLAHFRKELDTAMLNHFYRIIFIHGKGNGVLRNRIRAELDAMNLKYMDADTAKFGFGATEVML
ncbi:MAG TPA: Smr/MutS family protein [Bacteroidia bacterium]|nr:Smr/MutS family protein [Bacteroidia bacterium]